MVATLEPHKDHETLLRAWAQFSEAHPESHLYLAGNGSLMSRLKSFASELHLERISFLGSVSDVPQLLHRCKWFVFSTTQNEGFGTVLIEALAAGCLVIASDVPACREVLADGKYGLLVRAHDPEALATAMTLPMEDRVADAGSRQHYAAQFTASEMMRKYVEIAFRETR
jgi:glycosyltransferase involved in cell wall biosynthesis